MLPSTPYLLPYSRQAAAVASGFTPASISPFLWIDPSDLTTLFVSNAGTTSVAADGDLVGYAADKSGNAFDLNSNANDTSRPTYKNVSSIQYISFNGTNNALKRLANAGLYNAGTVSIFLAMRSNPALNTTMLCEGGSVTTNTIGGWLMSNNVTATLPTTFIRNDAGSGALNNWGASATGLDNTWRVLGLTWDGTTITPYINGLSTTNITRAAGDTFTSDRFSLGCRWRNSDGLANFGAIDVAGLVIKKSVLSAGDKASLITWLGAKVGLSL